MASHPIPLPCTLLGLTVPQPSRRHHAKSLLGPSLHDPRTHHVLESYPEQAAPGVSPAAMMSDATPSALTPPLHCASICCSLQHLLKLLLLSLGPSLLQIVSIVSPHSPSLRFGLPAPQPSRRHHAQSLLGPSFLYPGTHHVLESHPEQAAPLSRRDDERCHRLSLRTCTAPPSCSLQPLLKLSLLSLGPSLLQFVSIVSPLLNHGNPFFEPVCVFYIFLFCLYFSDRNELQL